MEHTFEPIPIIVAAIIGAIAFSYFIGDQDQNAMAHGALTGALVQIGVRLLGVS